MVALGQGQLLYERGANIPGAVIVRHSLGVVERGIDRSLGIEVVDGLQHLLGAAMLVQPVVDDGHLHAQSVAEGRRGRN